MAASDQWQVSKALSMVALFMDIVETNDTLPQILRHSRTPQHISPQDEPAASMEHDTTLRMLTVPHRHLPRAERNVSAVLRHAAKVDHPWEMQTLVVDVL